jgi:hypothetical protein
MSEEAYRQYTTRGADGVDLAVVRQALKFASEHPSEALRIRRVHEQVRRELEEQAEFEAAYILHGGTAEQARKAYEQQVADERARRAVAFNEEARTAAAQRTRGVF